MSIRIARLSVICFVMLLGAETPPTTQPSPKRMAAAKRFADHLRNGRFAEAAEPFDSRMTELMPVPKLKEVWEQIEKQCGAFQSFGEPRLQKLGTADAVIFPGKWNSVALDMQVVFDEQGRISGLWFKPAATQSEYKAPSYVRPRRFRERDVKVGQAPYVLEGKFVHPRKKGKVPGVVLVHGSGPNDLDETIGPNRPFRDIAWGLASKGIAVLRYNKRTATYGAVMKPIDVNVRAEVLDDALAALKVLRAQPEVDADQTFLLGHSLGGCLAPVIARDDGRLAGYVILSGTLRPLTIVVLEQLAYIASLPGEQQAEARKALDEAKEAIQAMPSKGKSGQAGLLGAPVSYWRDLENVMAGQGPGALRAFRGRVLIVGGGRDYQITEKDFAVWKRVGGEQASVRLKWFADCNHLYMKGKGKATPAEYMKPGHVDRVVVEALARFIKGEPEPIAASGPATSRPGEPFMEKPAPR